ncbi:MAG: 4Fe-4S dicluster domain-containing protein [Desulfovibrio sp.]|jgi:tetrathionate reductase subunit B|nr:4Fe-4S dicluster domain-containing protein [Desulfovibrio sp.]
MNSGKSLPETRSVSGMVIDASRCIDCKACLVSCKVANGVPAGQSRNWIKTENPGLDALTSGFVKPRVRYQPGGCMQCADAPCLNACPTGATYRTPEDGVIHVDKGLCIGCGNCIQACPYGARFRHARQNVADKCDFCAPRRARGLMPACVDTCITKARTFGPLDAATRAAAKRFAEEGAPPVTKLVRIEPPAYETGPKLLYVNDTAPRNWPAYPEQPLPVRIMTGPPGRMLFAASGASLFAVLLMGITQFRERRMHPHSASEQHTDRNASGLCPEQSEDGAERRDSGLRPKTGRKGETP